MEDEHAEREAVRFRPPHLTAKRFALQLRRGVLQFADGAGIGDDAPAAPRLHLKGIAVNHRDERGGRNEDITLIEIADDVARPMERREDGGEIAGRAGKVAAVECRERAGAQPGVEDLKERHGPGDMRHEETRERRAAPVGGEYADRPGEGRVPAAVLPRVGWMINHPGEFVAQAGRWLRVNLGDQSRLPRDEVDITLAAPTDAAVECHRPSARVVQDHLDQRPSGASVTASDPSRSS